VIAALSLGIAGPSEVILAVAQIAHGLVGAHFLPASPLRCSVVLDKTAGRGHDKNRLRVSSSRKLALPCVLL
jgi:hypothetical protein